MNGTLTITGEGTNDATKRGGSRKKQTILKNCVSEINNMQVDNAKDLDVLMPMYNLI